MDTSLILAATDYGFDPAGVSTALVAGVGIAVAAGIAVAIAKLTPSIVWGVISKFSKKG